MTIKIRQTNGKWVSFGSGLRTIYLNHTNDNHFDLLDKKNGQNASKNGSVTTSDTNYMFWHMLILNVGLFLVYLLVMVVEKSKEFVLYSVSDAETQTQKTFINQSNHIFWLGILNTGLFSIYYFFPIFKKNTEYLIDNIIMKIVHIKNNTSNMFWFVVLLNIAFIITYLIGKYDVLLVVSLIFSWYFYNIKKND